MEIGIGMGIGIGLRIGIGIDIGMIGIDIDMGMTMATFSKAIEMVQIEGVRMLKLTGRLIPITLTIIEPVIGLIVKDSLEVTQRVIVNIGAIGDNGRVVDMLFSIIKPKYQIRNG